ncbi:MAG: hypothetical protein RBT46_08775 [Weeksellaceae bacterium]|jgi:hypothetical protein|nr:hypothetical protein [Weeksellaceae bacterium]MDX9705782.1 hypothetical protein [Weeksellaceae bacterium]
MKKYIYSLVFLFFGLSVLTAQSTKLVGKIKINPTSKVTCFYVDQEMVDVGIVQPLGNKVNTSCQDSKYGTGTVLDFNKLDSNSDYPDLPMENTLIEIAGNWKKSDFESYIFYVIRWEPFF